MLLSNDLFLDDGTPLVCSLSYLKIVNDAQIENNPEHFLYVPPLVAAIRFPAITSVFTDKKTTILHKGDRLSRFYKCASSLVSIQVKDPVEYHSIC